MKINSHLLGFGIGAIAIAVWMWCADKELETFLGWRIFKSRGVFKVEYLSNTRDQNPTFKTLEEAKVWISAKVAMDKLKTAIPWGSQ
jgi:hypothetical protein